MAALEPQIVSSQRVPGALAMRLPTMRALDILQMRDGLEMTRVDAATNAAEVIEGEPHRNGSAFALVCPAMSEHFPRPNREESVSGSIRFRCPRPTRTEV